MGSLEEEIYESLGKTVRWRLSPWRRARDWGLLVLVIVYGIVSAVLIVLQITSGQFDWFCYPNCY